MPRKTLTELKTDLEKAASFVGVGSDWLHCRTHRYYLVVDVVLRESDMEPLVIYSPPLVEKNVRFSQPLLEFLERFKEVLPLRPVN